MSTNHLLEMNSQQLNEKSVSEVENSVENKEMENDSTTKQPNLESSLNNKSEDETSILPIGDELVSVPVSISIKFHDGLIAKLYQTKFLKFISSFEELKVQNVSDLTIDIHRDQDSANKSNEEVVSDTCETPISPKKRKKHSKAKKELFTVDVTPSPNTVQTELRYTTKFTINTDKVEDESSQTSKSCCFNCGELHQLRDCPQPKDHGKINAARQKFKGQSKTSRYHIDHEKYSHLQPGRISNELRRALGLHKNEAPHYIYLMRRFGYPPGWLEEAKFVHSNLDMFDIDGKNVKSLNAKKGGLDESQIVEYSGFNVPFQKGVKDDYQMYGVPPYSENFNKNAMICFFNKKFTQEEDNFETCDMELDNDPDCMDINEKKEKIVNFPVDRDSPSLIDLENQKKQLLDELNEEPKVETKCPNNESEKGFLAVKTTCFGTPLLKSSSPYARLPNPDNFSKDVSPVINFENLPNSTGKYEQLSDVLQKVRDTLKTVHSCKT